MVLIRPISDLRNNFAEISKTVDETSRPVFLTEDGYGKMVVMSMEAYQNMQFEREIDFKLLESEREAERDPRRYTSEEVYKSMIEIAEGV